MTPETNKQIDDKREELRRESWIKNVIRVRNLSREEAEALYEKISRENFKGEMIKRV